MKKDLYILSAFFTNGSPPSSAKFGLREGYVFYPFNYTGNILTLDFSVWNKPIEEVDNFSKSFNNESEIQEYLENIQNGNHQYSIMALVDQDSYSDDSSLAVSKLYPFFNIGHNFQKKYLGIDVLDILTETSLLTNIELTEQEAEKIQGLKININQFGLIDSKEEAIHLINIASSFVVEHQFYPVYVYEILKAHLVK